MNDLCGGHCTITVATRYVQDWDNLYCMNNEDELTVAKRGHFMMRVLIWLFEGYIAAHFSIYKGYSDGNR